MSDDNVIHPFPSKDLPENPLEIAPKPAGTPYHCQHDAIRIDAFERTINCAKCGASLDPFNFLLHQATVLQTAWTNYRATYHQLHDITDRVAHLKKEEQNLKARIKRLQEKLPTIVINPPNK